FKVAREVLNPAAFRLTLTSMSTDIPSCASSGPSLLEQMRPALVKFFLRKTGRPSEAEDLTQEVLIRSLTHAHWNSLEDAKGYLFRRAVNRWHDYQRKARRQVHTIEWSEAFEERLGSENPPDDVLIVREALNQASQTIEAMSERMRTIVVLVQLEQMKVATV